MTAETKKILDPRSSSVTTCMRMPVFIGQSKAVNIGYEQPISPEEARDILHKAPGMLVIDKHEPGGYVSPHEAARKGAPCLAIRSDPTMDDGLALSVVSDNLRKGAALNAVQIAETWSIEGPGDEDARGVKRVSTGGERRRAQMPMSRQKRRRRRSSTVCRRVGAVRRLDEAGCAN